MLSKLTLHVVQHLNHKIREDVREEAKKSQKYLFIVPCGENWIAARKLHSKDTKVLHYYYPNGQQQIT